MTVGDLITMLRAYPNDDEIEIQVFETNSGELIDSTSAIGIVEGKRPGVKFCVSDFRQSQEWRWKTGRILAWIP